MELDFDSEPPALRAIGLRQNKTCGELLDNWEGDKQTTLTREPRCGRGESIFLRLVPEFAG